MYEPKALADRLLLERRRSDIDQIELGRRANVSGGYISDIERGKVTNIGIEKLFAIADALGISAWYLAGQTDDPLYGMEGDDEQTPENSVNELTREFLNIFQQLSDDKKRALLDLARMLRSSDEPRIIGKETN